MKSSKTKLLISFFILLCFSSFSQYKGDIKSIELNSNNLKIESANYNNESKNLNKNEYNFNEIPQGVQLITSEEEWKLNSPFKSCCCYPEFNEKNKHLGLLYNFKAFEKAKSYLQSKQSTSTLCTKQDWDLIFNDLKNNSKTFNALKLNFYPGYYDQTWYSPEDFQAGYWIDENTLVSFSKETNTEPMIDENVINDNESKRQSLIALSIRLHLPVTNSCNIDHWDKENSTFKGNQIKFITKQADWNRDSPNIPCCCYINFDISNESYGFLYNYKALEILKNDKTLADKRIALEKDWNQLLSCIQIKGGYGNLFNCQENNFNGFNLIPNGYYDNDKWTTTDKGLITFWSLDNQKPNVIQFNCANKEELVKPNELSNSELEKRKNFAAYMIRFIKL